MVKPALALVAATVMWAANYVVGAAALQTIPPIELAWWRWVLAALPLLLLAHAVEKPDWRVALSEWRLMLVLSVCGVGGYTLLLYGALSWTTPLSASLINAAGPAVMLLLAAVVLREPVGLRAALGVAVGITGAVVITASGFAGPGQAHVGGGELLAVGATIAFAAYTILGRRVRSPPVTATAVQATITALLLTPFAVAGGAEWPGDPATAGSLLFIVAFPSIGAYVFWNSGARRIAAGRAGNFLNLIPVFVAIFSVLGGSRLSPVQILGGLLVFVGVALNSARGARKVA